MNSSIKQYNNLFSVLLACLVSAVLGIGGSGCAVQRPKIDIPKMAPPPKPIKNVNVALVLGAGGSRGLAHLGVIEVLEREGIPIDLIVGSSAGSLAGALYADTPDIACVKEKVINLKRGDLLDPSFLALMQVMLRPIGPIQGNALEHFLIRELKVQQFEDLKIPLVAVATNVDNYHLTLLRSGPIAPAVHASAALPPLFSPVFLYNETLVDGGVVAPVPVQAARAFKPKLIIAVDISTPPSREYLSNAVGLLYRALHISFYELSKMQSTSAEITIHPDLEGFGSFDDHCNNQLYDRGKEAAEAALPSIKEFVKKKGIKLKKKTPSEPPF